MPYRKTFLATGEYYHIFNRGVAKMPNFTTPRDYQRFVETIRYYMVTDRESKFSQAKNKEVNSEDSIVDVVTYCLMPNHFHLLLRQKKDGGISSYMRDIGISYTKYFNVKHERVGPLFQGQFKAIYVETDEQLLHLSRYIHINPTVGNVVKSVDEYPWSSYFEYMDIRKGFCQKDVILANFSTKDSYKQFLLDQEDYGKKLAAIKHLLIDE